MKVLMLTSSYPKYPGDVTAPVIERIAFELGRRGHAVDLVLPRHPDLVLTGRDGGYPIRFFPFYAGPPRRYAWGYASSMKADRQIRAKTLAVAPVAFLSALTVTRRLVARGNYDLVHAHWVLPNGPIAALAAGKRLPLVLSLHGSDVFVAEKSAVLGTIARWTFRRANWVAACAGDLAERAVALGSTPERTNLLLHGVEVDDFASGDGAGWRRRIGAAESDLVVVALGRLVAKKGFSALIRAAARLRAEGSPVRVAIGGTGDLGESLAAEARDCGEPVCFLGDVAHDQVGGLFAAADLVAVPSVRDERGNVDGLPNVLLEAMAAGRPVVASRIAGIPDVVAHGENGLLVPPGDEGGLAEAIRRLRADVAERRRLAAAGAATARALSWSAYGDRLIEGYERVLTHAPAR